MVNLLHWLRSGRQEDCCIPEDYVLVCIRIFSLVYAVCLSAGILARIPRHDQTYPHRLASLPPAKTHHIFPYQRDRWTCVEEREEIAKELRVFTTGEQG